MEEHVPILIQMLSPGSLDIFSFTELSLKSLCISHTRHRHVPEEIQPQDSSLFLLSSFCPSQSVKLQVSSLFLVYLIILFFNAAMCSEVMLGLQVTSLIQ